MPEQTHRPELTPEQVADIFSYHPPTERQTPQYGIIRSAARELALAILAEPRAPSVGMSSTLTDRFQGMVRAVSTSDSAGSGMAEESIKWITSAVGARRILPDLQIGVMLANASIALEGKY